MGEGGARAVAAGEGRAGRGVPPDGFEVEDEGFGGSLRTAGRPAQARCVSFSLGGQGPGAAGYAEVHLSV